MTTPKLTNCFHCQNMVHEFEDGIFGCESCKTAWVYEDGGWYKYDTENGKAIKKNRISGLPDLGGDSETDAG